MPTIEKGELHHTLKEPHPDILGDVHAVEVEAQEFSFTDLYDRIVQDEDVIIIIDAIEETRVRKGLSSVKAKRNAKLKDADLPADTSTLEFVKHEDKELAAKHQVRLQIVMKKPPKVMVHSLKVADGEL